MAKSARDAKINQLRLTCHYKKPLSLIKGGFELLGWDIRAVFHPLRLLHLEEQETLHKGLIALIDANGGFSKSWNFQKRLSMDAIRMLVEVNKLVSKAY